MRKIKLLLASLFLGFFLFTFTGCGGNDKVIRVCASELPHADVLNNKVKDLLEKKGYKLEVTVLDWTLQNDAVAQGDYDANYFQHVPYLETYSGKTELFAACKVHYEPLGIYRGKSNGSLKDGTTFEICNDPSNAIRAFQLLKAKGVLTEIPVNEAGDALTFSGNTYQAEGKTITLIAEDLLVASMSDYDFALLPCNTAYTGRIGSDKQVAKEDDPIQVALKANIIAARKEEYKTNEIYRGKIDVLVDALLSSEVSEYFQEAYLGAMTCNSSSQIDLRQEILNSIK